MSLAAGKLISERIKKAGQFSLEVFVRPADTRHRGPARIVSISYDGQVRNLSLCQEGAAWHVRLRNSARNPNGTSPDVRVSGLATRWTHVVVAYDGRRERLYLNGREAADSSAVAGNLGSWETARFPLVIGNEAHEARNWAGTVAFVAFYTSVLTPEQVARGCGAPPPGVKVEPPGGSAGRRDVF
jgi:hypothetical protein